MEPSERPDPDILLARVQEEELRQSRGKLKIFLGYAAGVGKTYAMLQAAWEQKAQGRDVLAALIETHGRKGTEALLEGMPILPRMEIEHRGVHLQELDLDGLLARRPGIALVDELAHSNVPGVRHRKRWQDVKEILSSGIDVYTTLNIQHLESLNDLVAQITGVVVRETVPDPILDEAEDIELVDLPPPELLERLSEGKVYIPEQAVRASQKFFKKGNLIAIRELSLRRTANRVNEEMLAYRELRSITGPWATQERLLVCVSGSPFSERLIRATRRLAEELRAEWQAVYVETPVPGRMAQENREHVWREMRLAESLGGRVSTLSAPTVHEAVLEFSRKHNITKVVVGKPSRRVWHSLFRPSLVERLIRSGAPLDVVVVDLAQEPRTLRRTLRLPVTGKELPRYGAALVLIGGATLICGLAHLVLTPVNLVMIYLLAVVVAALRLGLRPALFTAVAAVLAFDFFFVPPTLTMAVEDTQYLITFTGFLTVGLVISSLVAKARAQAEAVRVREIQTDSLYTLSRDLASAAGRAEVVEAVVRNLGETLDADVVLLLPGSTGIEPAGGTPGLNLGEKELAVADWVWQNGQGAGLGTDTLGSAAMRHIPLLGATLPLGVLAVRPRKEGRRRLAPDEAALLDSFAHQISLALERIALAEQAQLARLLEEAEKLHRAVMNSISHDLRTPLVTITGAISSLREEGDRLPASSRQELLDGAWEEAGRLNRFVGNLLEMSRLEAGILRPRMEPCDVQDLLGVALSGASLRLTGREVTVEADPELPLVPMDFVLMTQVLGNLLENASKFSPQGSPIQVTARVEEGLLEMAVADQGAGIPEDQLERVFDKFTRLHRSDEVVGTGLGLTICRGIVEAHGGTVKAYRRTGGGTRLVVRLPLTPKGPEVQNGA